MDARSEEALKSTRAGCFRSPEKNCSCSPDVIEHNLFIPPPHSTKILCCGQRPDFRNATLRAAAPFDFKAPSHDEDSETPDDSDRTLRQTPPGGAPRRHLVREHRKMGPPADAPQGFEAVLRGH